MKKLLLLSLLVASFTTVGASATPDNPPQTDVTGVVSDNGDPVGGAVATVECNGHTKQDTTDTHGSYVVTFTAVECPQGSTVKLTAQKDGKSGVASNVVQGVTTKLNLAIVNVTIPEYGTIGLLLAGGAGIGALAYARRRQAAFITPSAL